MKKTTKVSVMAFKVMGIGEGFAIMESEFSTFKVYFEHDQVLKGTSKKVYVNITGAMIMIESNIDMHIKQSELTGFMIESFCDALIKELTA
jgi:hypothetical protein